MWAHAWRMSNAANGTRFGEASHPGPRNMRHPSKIVLMLNDCTRTLMKVTILWTVVLCLYLIFSYFRLSNAANGTRFGEASHPGPFDCIIDRTLLKYWKEEQIDNIPLKKDTSRSMNHWSDFEKERVIYVMNQTNTLPFILIAAFVCTEQEYKASIRERRLPKPSRSLCQVRDHIFRNVERTGKKSPYHKTYSTVYRETREKTVMSKYQSVRPLKNILVCKQLNKGKFIIKKKKKERKKKKEDREKNTEKKNKKTTWEITHNGTARTFSNGFIYCMKCSGVFYNKHVFQNHVNNFHQLGFRCSLCKGLFRSKKELIVHKTTHTATSSYCKICDTSFTKHEFYKVHKNWYHTGFEQVPDELFGDVDLKFLYDI